MFCWITILVGVLIMMGHHARSEGLFYYFRLEDQVPETHLLRLIEKHIKFAFVREKLKDSYSETGRPSIDPELLLRVLLIGYLYGITSERKLVEELRMHLAWRWFTGLGFDQEIPHHSTFSKNRHGRFQESKLFEQLFEEIVARCLEAGLVQGDNLSVDGSFVEANAAKESRIPREQLAEAAQVNQTVRQYLVELEQQNPTEELVHQQDQVSTTDPDATYATKGGALARLGYYDNYLVDNRSCVIVGVQATAARMSQETVAAKDMIARFAEWQGREPESVVADATYGNGEFLQWLMERGITPYMRTRDSALRKNNPLYGPDHFTYLPESNSYLCPAGQQLNFVGLNVRNRTHAYIGSRKRCGGCSQKAQHHGPVQVSCHPHPRTRPATRSRLSQHCRLCERAKTEKKGGGIVCGTQKSDRSSSLASAEIKVCSRAVLPGCGRAEHQKIGPLPQPRTKITAPGNNLVSSSQETLWCCGTHIHQLPIPHSPFSTPTGDYTQNRVNECDGDVSAPG
jgi:transposase